MKLKHVSDKKANRQFDKGQTGFANELERKMFNQSVFSKDKTHKGFMKSKPVRIKRVRQTVKNK